MRKKAPLRVHFYHPVSVDGIRELSNAMVKIQAQAIHTQIKEHPCPTPQKLQLLDAVLADIRKEQHK